MVIMLITTPNPQSNMGKTYYTYEGKKVGVISKVLSDVVLLKDEWIDAANKEFAEQGYGRLLGGIQKTLRYSCEEELTDAQLWMLIHHITNLGVPQAMRTDEDEKSTPVKFVQGAVGMAAGVADTGVNAAKGTAKKVGDTVSKPFKGEESEENSSPETSPP